MIQAVLGGSFDPFHNGHVAMVRVLLERGLADRVLVVPAHRSPHKPPPEASPTHRLKMAALGLIGLSGAELSAREIVRGGVSYTVETLEELARERPAVQLRLVLGADNLAAFDRWHRPERILELAEPVIFARGDWDGGLPPALSGRAHLVRDFAEPVTATAVRAALAAGEWPAGSVPAPVLGYIATHRLYGCRGTPPVAGPRREA
jgi:nicotinate-nucleotide adenylyltransferase